METTDTTISTPTAPVASLYVPSDEFKTKVHEFMRSLFELPEERLIPSAHLFQDLGLDSLDAIDLAMHLQVKYNVMLSNEQMQSIRTLQDIYDLESSFTNHVAPQ